MIRIASAAALLALVLATLWILPAWATLVLAAVTAALAAAELAHLATLGGVAVPAGFTAPAAAIVVAAFVAGSLPAAVAGGAAVFGATLLALVIGAGAITLTLGPPAPPTLTRAAVLVFAPLYAGLPLGALAWVQWVHGPGATTWLLGVVAASDSAQYYTGRAFGRTKLAPVVSPAKTREGVVGGVLTAAIAGAALAAVWLPHLSWPVAAAIAGALALSGVVGDLFESLIKRSVGAKDSSQLIPGHGGVLDRIDSHLFAAPVYYVILLFLAGETAAGDARRAVADLVRGAVEWLA